MPVTRITDGFKTTLASAIWPDEIFHIKSVNPGGVTKGGGIDITSMENDEVRTVVPKILMMYKNMTLAVGYNEETFDPDTIDDYIGVNAQWVMTLPRGGTITFWGFADDFTAGTHSSDEAEPVGSLTIIFSHLDDDLVETKPVYAAGP